VPICHIRASPCWGAGVLAGPYWAGACGAGGPWVDSALPASAGGRSRIASALE